MVELTPKQIAPYWLSNGGTQGTLVIAVAVALAESGGDPNAVSPTSDYGLWQINAVHESDAPSEWPRILEPGINADFAAHISQQGTNWGPWATCYANLGQSGWSTYLAGPQPGSAAANYLAFVASELSQPAPVQPAPAPYVPPPPVAPGEGEVDAAWSLVQDWHNYAAPGLLNRVQNAQSALGEVFA